MLESLRAGSFGECRRVPADCLGPQGLWLGGVLSVWRAVQASALFTLRALLTLALLQSSRDSQSLSVNQSDRLRQGGRTGDRLADAAPLQATLVSEADAMHVHLK